MLQRQARAAVGAVAHAQLHLVALGLGDGVGHGRGSGVALGVDADVGRVVIAAAGQALLGIHQLLLVVDVTGLEPRQPLGQLGRVAAGPLHGGRTQAEQRAGIEPQAELDPRLGRAHVGQAVGDAALWVTALHQAAQGAGLGARPAVLREAAAFIQAPVGHDAFALADGVRIGRGGDVALEADVHPGDGGGLAGRDGDHHRGPRTGRAFAAHTHVGVEVALGAQQVAHVALGHGHQAGEFGFVQVGEGAVALQFAVALDQPAQVLVLALHTDVEGGDGRRVTRARAHLAGGGGVGAWRGRRGRLGVVVEPQPGATRQHQQQRQQGGGAGQCAAGRTGRRRIGARAGHPLEFSGPPCRTRPRFASEHAGWSHSSARGS